MREVGRTYESEATTRSGDDHDFSICADGRVIDRVHGGIDVAVQRFGEHKGSRIGIGVDLGTGSHIDEYLGLKERRE